MRQSILKKTPTTFDFKHNDQTKDNFITNVSSMSTSKIVRFSGIDTDDEPTNDSNSPNLTNMDELNDVSENKVNIGTDDVLDEEATNELRKYYRKSRSLPFRQINLIGLNGEFIVAASPTTPLVSQFASFNRQPKTLPRSKSMRIVSAKSSQQQQQYQLSDFRLTRQNTCPTISKNTPLATQVKTPTSKYELPNQTFYYWPSAQVQTPNHYMSTLPRSPLNHSSQSNYIKSPSTTKISSQSTSQLLNNSPIAYKSTGSSIPLLNNRFLNTNLFFSSTYSPSTPMISADKLVNLDAPLSPKTDSSVSCTNIDSYSNQLMNSNILPSRSNSSNSLTLYTYLVQSGSSKNLKKDTKTNHIRVQQHQSVKKNSDSNTHVDFRTATSTDLAQHLNKSHKFSSLADNFLNTSSITTSLSRTLNARRSVEPLIENQVAKSTLNGLYSPMRLRTSSANTISSTAIK